MATRHHLQRAVIGAAAVLFAASSASAQCPGTDDAFEDNDDCASAVPLALGLYPGLYVETAVSDSDAYLVQIPANEALSIDLFFTHADGNIDVLVRNATCVGVLGVGFSVTDDEHVEVVNGSNAPLDVVVEVFVTSATPTDCNTYDLQLSAQSDPCSGISDDFFEDNDDCASAPTIPSGTTPTLVVFQDDPDFFEVLLDDGDELFVSCSHVHADGDVNLFLYDPTAVCGGGLAGSPLAYSITQTDGESLSWRNTSGSARSLILEVTLSQIVPSGCNTYDLTVAQLPDSCNRPDDPFEPNDTCMTAFPSGAGSMTGLYVSQASPDFFAVTVQPGDVLGVDCTYVWQAGPLLVLLWDANGPCATGVYTNELARSVTPMNNERVFWLNDTGAAVDVIVEVATAGPRSACNDYDLAIATFPDPCPGGLGKLVCRGLSNSTGAGSSLCAAGSDAVDDNDVLLTVTGLPPNAMGYFVVSRAPVVALPMAGGSVGELCIAGQTTGRQPPVLSSSFTGTLQLQLDLQTTALPAGPVAIVAGETWCWQLWHRDVGPGGGAVSNFSSARSILFR